MATTSRKSSAPHPLFDFPREAKLRRVYDWCSKRVERSMQRKIIGPLLTLAVASQFVVFFASSQSVGVAHAGQGVGSILGSLSPAPSGNGRALAFDPVSAHLFYTNSGDPHIYVIDTSGSRVATLSPVVSGRPVVYAALSWGRGALWGGGRYDGSGIVDQ